MTTTAALSNTATLARTERIYDDAQYLRSRLSPDSKGNVNEEQLFAAIIAERIKVTVNPAVAEKFEVAIEKARKAIGKRANAEENAARRALNELVKSGTISKTGAQKIHAEAFAAAQLDKNPEKLFDSTGGKKDRTQATAPVDIAVQNAIKALNRFDSGKETATPRAIIEI